MKDSVYLAKIAKAFKEKAGAKKDFPEGVDVITISCTLAKAIAEELVIISERIKKGESE
jgi:hypothetical protein